MSKITVEEFKNFFKYYGSLEHQQRAIEELYQDIDADLLTNQSDWINIYRKTEDKEQPQAAKKWAITKQDMATIMDSPIHELSDSLLDDYTRCVTTFKMDRLSQVYFLGQCGHESAGLRYPVEIHDGSNYEMRSDLGNIYPGDGVKFAGTGYIQVTGRYNHQEFSDYLDNIGQQDYRVMDEGKTYTSKAYPWTISGYWWHKSNMNAYCANRGKCTNFQIDEVGARVNGRMRPNGADNRIDYTDRAYRTLLMSSAN